jgi:hypothetical protein
MINLHEWVELITDYLKDKKVYIENIDIGAEVPSNYYGCRTLDYNNTIITIRLRLISHNIDIIESALDENFFEEFELEKGSEGDIEWDVNPSGNIKTLSSYTIVLYQRPPVWEWIEA